MGAHPDLEAVAEEQRRADRLRRTVDVTCAVLRQGRLGRADGEALVAFAREQALCLFPDRGDVFDLVLAPRFRRILDECCPPARGRVLPFRPTGSRT
jgi:hypothetical protein